MRSTPRDFFRASATSCGRRSPVGVVLHPLGLYVMFSIGVGLIVIAAALEAGPGFPERFMRPVLVPAFLVLLAGLAWAALSILWTPYPVAAAHRC